MMDFKKIRAIIFDLDGTLIDSMEIWREIDEDFFARRKQQVPEGYQEQIAHLGFRECAKFTVEKYLPQESEDALIEEWNVLCREKYRAKDSAKYFKPGALELVRRFKERGVRLCVATASSPDYFMPVLEKGGVAQLFDVYATVEETGKNKSFPDIFLNCAKKLKVRPEECAVFEDNLIALRSAKSCGMCAVGVYDAAAAAFWAQMRSEADLAIESFEELLQK